MAETVKLTAADANKLDAYLARPEGTPKGGLVVCQEIFGVNHHIRAVAEGFASQGFLAVAPALFDRVKPGVELDYTAEGIAEGRALRTALVWEDVMADVAAAIKAAREAGAVGVVGYCWGGSLAWLAACRLEIAAAVGYYGGQIHEHRQETPRAPVLLHFGAQDELIPPAHVAEIRRLHPTVQIFTYPAGHGFNCDARADFDEDSAGIAGERTFAFLDEHLT
jgi:carboxymethylenebutenolidase